ncbi:MAG: hypothetical protein RIC55_14660 [Pirellulaceae bacterium]
MEAKREASFASSLLAVAFVLTLWALFMNNVDFAVNDDSPFVMQAVVCALLSTALIGGIWYWLPNTPRILSLLVATANLWTLVDAVGRRMLELYG